MHPDHLPLSSCYLLLGTPWVSPQKRGSTIFQFILGPWTFNHISFISSSSAALPGVTASMDCLFMKAHTLLPTSLFSKRPHALAADLPTVSITQRRKSCHLSIGCQENDYRRHMHTNRMNVCGSLFQTDKTKSSFLWLERFLSAHR